MHQRVLRFIFTAFLLVVFLYPITSTSSPPEPIKINLPSVVRKVSTIQPRKTLSSPQITYYSASQIEAGIQSLRRQINLEELVIDPNICATGEIVFDSYTHSSQLSKNSLSSFCPTCSQKAYLAIDGNYNVDDQAPWFQSDQTQQLISQSYSHACIFAQNDRALLLLGNSTSNKTTSQTSSKTKNSDYPIYNFTENQLWQAFVDYRHAHTKRDILFSDSLCSYARERVSEHLSLYESKPKEEYVNQDKYPLDAHEGFMRDGDSGYVFEKTGFNVVAENLAFWPSAQYPHQVFEWGWDTSTEGHREAQLSDEYTHACISGKDGFYVAIFGRN